MEKLTYQGIDSRAMLATYITKLPLLFLLAVAGAILGSGLNLFMALADASDIVYVSETEYYIDFADGRYEARDYYNAFTWNDVLKTDLILGKAMDILGDGYAEDDVRKMISAEMPSDVRYLTVLVRGAQPSEVAEVKDAIGAALEAFPASKKELFDSIEQIKDLEIVQEEKQYFTWRAAFLGALIFLAAGIFVTAAAVSMGSAFYTKNDVMKILGIPACGMTFKGNKPIKRQLEMLQGNLRLLSEEYHKILLMDASDGVYAEAFLKYIADNNLADVSGFGVYAPGRDAEMTSDMAILAVVPFARQYREKIADEINYAALHGGKVAAAVLTQVDGNWMRIYYGRIGGQV